MVSVLNYLLLVLCPITLWGDVEPDMIEGEKALVHVANHVLVSRSQSVPGDLVCHDGTNLYFRDQKSCEMATPGDCDSLIISPIAEVEDLFLSSSTAAKVTRFYTIPLTYKVSVFQASKLSQWSHILVDEINKSIPTCSGFAIEDIQITYTERLVTDEHERKFLKQVLGSGFSTINTHRGRISDLSFIDKASPFLNVNRIDEDPDKTIGSPECQKKFSKEHLQMLSGEMSGNGITNGTLIMLQNLSGPMTPNQDDDSESAVACEGVWI